MKLGRCKGRSRQTIENCQVLRSRQDIATGVVFFFLTRSGILEVMVALFGFAIVRLSDHQLPCQFHSVVPRSGLASNLRSAHRRQDRETVRLGVMSAFANVPPRVIRHQHRAV